MSGTLLRTTTISVMRSTRDDDEELDVPYQGNNAQESEDVATGIPANIGSPSGAEIIAAGGQQSNMTFRFVCDPCDINHMDVIRDDSTGEKYQVQWVRRITALGMDYMSGALRLDKGSTYGR